MSWRRQNRHVCKLFSLFSGGVERRIHSIPPLNTIYFLFTLSEKENMKKIRKNCAHISSNFPSIFLLIIQIAIYSFFSFLFLLHFFFHARRWIHRTHSVRQFTQHQREGMRWELDWYSRLIWVLRSTSIDGFFKAFASRWTMTNDESMKALQGTWKNYGKSWENQMFSRPFPCARLTFWRQERKPE